MADNFQNFELLSHRNLELGRAPRGIKVTQFQKDFDARPRDAKTQKSVAACGRAGRPTLPPHFRLDLARIPERTLLLDRLVVQHTSV